MLWDDEGAQFAHEMVRAASGQPCPGECGGPCMLLPKSLEVRPERLALVHQLGFRPGGGWAALAAVASVMVVSAATWDQRTSGFRKIGKR